MFECNQIVDFDTRDHGRSTGVIVNIKIKSRGRHAGKATYTVAPLSHSGAYYKCDESHLAVSGEPYTEAQIQAAVEGQESVETGRQEIKQKRAHENYEAAATLDACEGDTILIRAPGNEPKWRAEVAEVNLSKGRIAISAPYNKSGKRWIDAANVVKVIIEEAPCPVNLSERVFDGLQEKGWAQVTYGREFIERSYVAAFTRPLAYKGRDYECASRAVRYDPETKLFWRETGSFD